MHSRRRYWMALSIRRSSKHDIALFGKCSRIQVEVSAVISKNVRVWLSKKRVNIKDVSPSTQTIGVRLVGRYHTQCIHDTSFTTIFASSRFGISTTKLLYMGSQPIPA